MEEPSVQVTLRPQRVPARTVTGRSSFSLIELMTVVAIIIILTGIALRVTTYVQRKTAQVQTQRIIEQLKNALGEYYTVYGTYPPGKNPNGTNVTSVVALTTNFVADPGNIYRRGLVCYLWAGAGYNQDPEARRWQHFLENVNLNLSPIAGVSVSSVLQAYTNVVANVHDGWGRTLRYQCYSPYQTYRLWSDGPNGLNNTGTVDDIGVKFTE